MLMCVYIKDQDCMLSQLNYFIILSTYGCESGFIFWNGHWNVRKDLERKSTGEGGSTIRVQVN